MASATCLVLVDTCAIAMSVKIGRKFQNRRSLVSLRALLSCHIVSIARELRNAPQSMQTNAYVDFFLFFLPTSSTVSPRRLSETAACLARELRPRTWRQRLLKLVCLLGIPQGERVYVSLAANLELNLLALWGLLDARRCPEH